MSKWSSAYRDSRWQRKRLEVMERDEWTCRSCGKSGEGVTLNVHHIHYEAGRSPWDYDDELLITWCACCHKERHDKQKQLLIGLAQCEPYIVDLIVGLVCPTQGPVMYALETALVHGKMSQKGFKEMVFAAMFGRKEGGAL